MTRYKKLVECFENNRLVAILLVAGAVITGLAKAADCWKSFAGLVSHKPTIASHSDTASSAANPPFVTEYLGEKVKVLELLRTSEFDVLKIEAYTGMLGVTAEYKWVEHAYPGATVESQALTSLGLLTQSKSKEDFDVKFDLLHIHLKDGPVKDIFFDISSFMPSKDSIARIKELYRNKQGNAAIDGR